MWVQLVIIVASLVYSYHMRPKPAKPKPPALSDFDFPMAEEGTPQYVVFGDCWVEDWMVLAVGNYRTDPIKKKGGKK